MSQNIKVLVIDDDAKRRHDLKVVLDFLGEQAAATPWVNWQKNNGYESSSFEDCVAVILGDSCLPIPLKERLQAVYDWDDCIPVITLGERQLLTDEEIGQLDQSLQQMLIASFSSPPTYTDMLDTLHRAQCYRQAYLNNKQRDTRRPVQLFRSLVGTSRQVRVVRDMMNQVADKDVTVLITGESGTGKEVVARNLHRHSKRSKGPFVPVNCGAIPAELLESELFGHEKGAFTGAINSRAGRFEMAEGGTLFLDEIGDMPLNMQVKILRVLQEKCFERVGGNKFQKTDVRVIAATHRNLEDMIAKGQFREDLYYRLNVFPIEMPSLRERVEDIPLLLNELVSRLEHEKRGSIRFNSAAIMSLCQHDWSGNVRELANLVERMAIMNPYGVVGVRELPAKYRHVDASNEDEFDLIASNNTSVVNVGSSALLPDQGIDLKEYISGLEKNLIQQALDDSGGVVARAADRLTIRRTTLVEKMRKYGLQRG